MKEGNRLRFGYGDIIIGHDKKYSLILYIVDKHYIAGKPIPDNNHNIITSIKIEVIGNNFIDKIDEVNIDNPTFEFDGYIFDFSNFNRGSIKAFKSQYDKLLYIHRMALGC